MLNCSFQGGFSEALNGTVDGFRNIIKHRDTVAVSEVCKVEPCSVVVTNGILRQLRHSNVSLMCGTELLTCCWQHSDTLLPQYSELIIHISHRIININMLY